MDTREETSNFVEGKLKIKEVMSNDPSHVFSSFSMKPYNFNHDNYLGTHAPKDLSPITISYPKRNDRKEKDKFFSNFLVL